MLTEKQQAILDFIQKYLKEHQYPPSVREIGKQFGIYPATVQDHLSALERKGCLQKQRFLSRSISVPESARRGGVPVVGSVAAGLPLLAQQNIEDVLQLPEEWAAPGAFLLRVKGDSMVGAHILDGDFVLVHPQLTASEGEIVVALIGDEATVKRFHKTEQGITLAAENPAFDPIVIPRKDCDSVRIAGSVAGVMRLVGRAGKDGKAERTTKKDGKSK
jgi:repressor LexA